MHVKFRCTKFVSVSCVLCGCHACMDRLRFDAYPCHVFVSAVRVGVCASLNQHIAYTLVNQQMSKGTLCRMQVANGHLTTTW
jgi:hypothetical protein